MRADLSRLHGASQAGFSLIEVLVTIIIVAIGLLGLAGLQARAITSEFESYQRSQAILLAHDMVERIRMNSAAKGDFKALSDPVTGFGYYGTTGANSKALTCPGLTRSGIDLCAWNDALRGAAVTKGGVSVGAIVGARGCISYDNTSELPGMPDTGVFTVSIVWQGGSATVTPTVNCANGLYGSELQRRVISVAFRFAKLD